MKIKVLSKNVASKIAAGEVVERPVSVIKELMENAIDAAATEIMIRVSDAGRKRIEVVDNGIGIQADDAKNAVERYATSKITSASDLNNIKTLGFRGEALASISAVSRFSIHSRIETEQVGFMCEIEGGKIEQVRATGRQVGTSIVVENLFFNVPARLKFLKSNVTEKRLINQLVSRYSLYYAHIRFSLEQDGKNILSTSGNGKREEILSSIFDLETARKLLPVHYSDAYIKIEGFTSPHDLTRASRRDIYFFINGRLVSDASVAAAITKGYYGFLMVGRYPITTLFIDIPPEEVDVNVHPTKAEIRLKDPPRVFTAIQRTIKKTISAYSPFPTVNPAIWITAHGSGDLNGSTDLINHRNDDEQLSFTQSNSAPGIDSEPRESIPLLRLIGQLGLTYIAAEGPDGLYLIDQHAAHERILYEKLSQEKANVISQFLLDPIIVTIPQGDVEQIHNLITVVNEIGFRTEEFGPQSYKITAVPQVLLSHDPKDAFLSAVMEDEDRGNSVDIAYKEAVISRICKRLAVKAGQILTGEEQVKLVRQLEKCRNPRTCPHGRPTMIHISVDSLDRRFGRRGSV